MFPCPAFVAFAPDLAASCAGVCRGCILQPFCLIDLRACRQHVRQSDKASNNILVMAGPPAHEGASAPYAPVGRYPFE